MSTLRFGFVIVAVLAMGMVNPQVGAAPLGTDFNYQGQLKLGGVPVTDTADFEFRLYDADTNGLLVAGPITVSDVAVVDGLFQVSLDFGVTVLDGSALWLEVAVRSPHDPGDTELFTTLDPRQPLTGVPYALQTRGIFVTDAGNVGIGTTGPAAKLGVAGDIRVQNKITSAAGGLILSGGGSGVRVDLDEDGGSADSFTIFDTNIERFRVDGDTGDVTIQGDVRINDNDLLLRGPPDPNHGLGWYGGAKLFDTTDVNGPVLYGFQGGALGSTNGGEKIALSWKSDGNVGIGTTTPATKLEVVGTMTATTFVGDGSGLTGLNGDLAGVLGQGNDAGGADMLNLGTVNAAAFSSTSPLQLQTAGTTRIYVDDVTGNVGIGTTTPEEMLTIDGGDLLLGRAGLITVPSRKITLRGAQFGNGGAIAQINFSNFDSDSAQEDRDVASIASYNNDTVDSGDLRFYTTEGVVGNILQRERMRITENGDVGIGTKSPNGQLHVSNGADPNIRFHSTRGPGGDGVISIHFQHQNGDGARIRATRASGDDDGMDLTFSTQPIGGSVTERMRIGPDGDVTINSSLTVNSFLTVDTNTLFVDATAGNVGIGTTTPTTKLNVVGTTELNGDVTINSNLTVDTDTLFVDGSSGNVGIGTVSPTAKLDVEGDIRFGTDFYAVADTDRTVIVSGKINSSGFTVSSQTTSGVTAIKLSQGSYNVNFPSGAFSGVPNVTVTPFNDQGDNRFAILEDTVGTSGFTVFFRNTSGSLSDASFNFIAIGVR